MCNCMSWSVGEEARASLIHSWTMSRSLILLISMSRVSKGAMVTSLPHSHGGRFLFPDPTGTSSKNFPAAVARNFRRTSCFGHSARSGRDDPDTCDIGRREPQGDPVHLPLDKR